MDGSKEFFQSSNGYYSKKELVWLDDVLSKNKDKEIIILQHFPILPTKSKWLETAKIENYKEVILKYNNIKAIISGHYGINFEEKAFATASLTFTHKNLLRLTKYANRL